MADLVSLLQSIRSDSSFNKHITYWHTADARSPVFGDWPAEVHDELREVLSKRGIERPYSHQAEAIAAIANGRHTCVVTPTASGKTLCYNVPVVSQILKNPESRALYLFPTKALAQDQMKTAHTLVTDLGRDIKIFTYDGDTPADARQKIRKAGHIVVTNPDMLHTGILPNHAKWIRLFENLKYVVVDELHQYRGVFGSHFANLIRRLRRLCQFYEVRPQFICCSATIANPKQLAEEIFECPFALVDKNGAPAGEKHVIFYNPPVINRELGIRKSCVTEAKRWALKFLEEDIQTISFARSRLRVEILTRELKAAAARRKLDPNVIKGYRGGYLPLERRAIEDGVRNGSIRSVISTNALELGIDIGQLQAVVMSGYPGTIASTWQQGGRAGRRREASVMVVVSSSAALDQFIIEHPRYFFSTTPESGLVNPDNLSILSSHVKCGAFELAFKDGEKFGPDVQAFLQFLEENEVVHRAGGRWNWTSASYPAENISLRSAAPENFVIKNTSDHDRIIGEVDFFSAPQLIHEQAVYMHQSATFMIDKLDWEGRIAHAREVEVDYYTDAITDSDLKVLTVENEAPFMPKGGVGSPRSSRNLGEVHVSTVTPKYKKIKFETHENVGYGDIHLPSLDLQTEAYWLQLTPELAAALKPVCDLGGAMKGLGKLMAHVVPVFALCDPKDIRALGMVRNPFSRLPAVFLYDAYPGGIGIARYVYDHDENVLLAALDRVQQCICKNGCPSCVGPSMESGDLCKSATETILQHILLRLPEPELPDGVLLPD